ncbi:MAG: nitrate- and nitrite sensing domain-containing protein [Novosphingobium sp.]|nr:nitrate- and nitrite sensing domain-containing protein [Novosphingobium sp.]
MIGFILNRSIAVRLVSLCLFPLVALVAVSSAKLYNEYKAAQEARTVLEVLNAAPAISNLVHELQKERGTSAGFIGSKGKTFADTIAARRTDTDNALEIFRTDAPSPVGRLAIPEFAEPYERAQAALAQLDEMRGKVTRFEISVPEMAGYYTPLISDLLDMVESTKLAIKDSEGLRLVIAYTALLQGKERAGIERAMGAAGFGAGVFKENIYLRFIALGAMQDTMFDTFNRNAMPDDVSFFRQTISGPVQDDVVALRKLAYAAPFGADISGVTGPQWFATSTARIDALKQVEDKVVATLHSVAATMASNANWTFRLLLTVVLVLVAGTAALSWIIYRSIVPPISGIVHTMRQLANNDTEVVVGNADRKDEIGEMARAVGVFRENAIERVRLEEQSRHERDRERHRQVHVEDLVGRFREIVARALDSTSAKADNMRSASHKLSEIASNAADQANSAQSATGSASENVQLMAAAAEELAASIRDIATQMSQADALMTDTEAKAISTNEDVVHLSESAEQIGSIVNLIRDIAEQTNLLALNATIEAARAGEAGRGFAVVASEVKELAGQTAKATEEIATQVAGIQNSTQGTAAAIQGITEAMKEVRGLTSIISRSVDEQMSATQEISQAVNAASSGTTTASGNVNSVTGSIQQTSEFAAEVDNTSITLAEATAGLAKEVEQFLADVAADVEERRKASRQLMREVVMISQDGRRAHGTILDASVSGARMTAMEGVSVGDDINVQLSNGRQIPATVVWVKDDATGVQFNEELHEVVELMAA